MLLIMTPGRTGASRSPALYELPDHHEMVPLGVGARHSGSVNRPLFCLPELRSFYESGTIGNRAGWRTTAPAQAPPASGAFHGPSAPDAGAVVLGAALGFHDIAVGMAERPKRRPGSTKSPTLQTCMDHLPLREPGIPACVVRLSEPEVG